MKENRHFRLIGSGREEASIAGEVSGDDHRVAGLYYICDCKVRPFLLQGVLSAHRLGWVDLDFECSALPGLIGIWQKQLDC